MPFFRDIAFWKRIIRHRCLPTLLLIFGSISVVAQAESIDPQQSTLSATTWQMHVPITGHFKTFSGDIRFDKAHPQDMQAKIEVDMRSLDLGNAEFNDEMKDGSWLDTMHFPKAFFMAYSAHPLPHTHNWYRVQGALTIRGKTRPVIVNIQVQEKGTQQIIEGRLPVKRLDLRAGQAEWQDISIIGDTIELKFHWVVAKKQKILKASVAS